MFKRYTAWAAAMLLASTTHAALAESALEALWGLDLPAQLQGCTATCGDIFSTCCHQDPTQGYICTANQACNTTCAGDCAISSHCAPTGTPQQPGSSQPVQKPSATQPPSTGEDYTTQTASAQEQKMLNLLNQDRIRNGLAPLTLDPELSRIARIKSADMRDNHYFAHESPTYGDVRAMLRRFGYDFTSASENIAHHANVDKAQAAFMSSSGHRANILSTAWTKVGIGIVTDASGYIYATQIFSK